MPAQLSLFRPTDDYQAPIVPDIVEAYLAWLKARVEADDFDPKGYEDNVRDLRRFARCFPVPIDDCEQKDLTAFLELHPQWKAAATKRRVCGEVIACFNWAASKDNPKRLIDYCPYSLPKAVSKLPYVPRRPAESHEYVTLMRFSSRELRRSLFFLRRTGCRRCEMVELLWSEVLLDDTGPLGPHIKKQWHKNRRRTGKPIVIALDAATVRWLRNLKRRTGGVGHVFRNCDGNPWKVDTFSQNLMRAVQRLGLDEGVATRVTAYCFRHKAACDGVKVGFSNRQVGDRLNTSEEMIKRVYSSHTAADVEYLSDIAAGMNLKRKRDVKPK